MVIAKSTRGKPTTLIKKAIEMVLKVLLAERARLNHYIIILMKRV